MITRAIEAGVVLAVSYAVAGRVRVPPLVVVVPAIVLATLLGLGMAMTGGFVLFGAWIARTSRVQRAQNDELLEAVRGVNPHPVVKFTELSSVKTGR